MVIGLIFISSFLLAGVITLIAIRLARIERPQFASFKEYAMHVFGSYDSKEKRAIGEKFVAFYVCVFAAAMLGSLYLISSLTSSFLLP